MIILLCGHIHKNNFSREKNIIYPGSTISMGFDELGEHGIIVGEIIEKKVNLNFVPIDNRSFIEFEIDVQEMNSKEDLIEYINTIILKENELCKIILKGKRNFLINLKEIQEFITEEKILKIKDETKIKYNIEELEQENSIRGSFIKKVKEKYSQGGFTEEEMERAIEIGLESMQ